MLAISYLLSATLWKRSKHCQRGDQDTVGWRTACDGNGSELGVRSRMGGSVRIERCREVQYSIIKNRESVYGKAARSSKAS